MEDRIVAVLPALIGEAMLGLAAILHEAVAIRVAIGVAPGERGFDIWPERRDGLDISGSLEIHSGQHDEKRCRVDAAVILAEGHLIEHRHFALPALVQDLARL